MKLTQWYSGDQKPVRVGVYQRKYTSDKHRRAPMSYSFWDGFYWSGGCINPDIALKDKRWLSGFQSIPWRGIAK